MHYSVTPEWWNGDVDLRVNSDCVTFVKGSWSSLGRAKLYIALVILFQMGAHKIGLDFNESDIIPVDASDVRVPGFNSRERQVEFEQKVWENSSSAMKSVPSQRIHSKEFSHFSAAQEHEAGLDRLIPRGFPQTLPSSATQ